jgi:hypothetical protein
MPNLPDNKGNFVKPNVSANKRAEITDILRILDEVEEAEESGPVMSPPTATTPLARPPAVPPAATKTVPLSDVANSGVTSGKKAEISEILRILDETEAAETPDLAPELPDKPSVPTLTKIYRVEDAEPLKENSYFLMVLVLTLVVATGAGIAVYRYRDRFAGTIIGPQERTVVATTVQQGEQFAGEGDEVVNLVKRGAAKTAGTTIAQALAAYLNANVEGEWEALGWKVSDTLENGQFKVAFVFLDQGKRREVLWQVDPKASFLKPLSAEAEAITLTAQDIEKEREELRKPVLVIKPAPTLPRKPAPGDENISND